VSAGFETPADEAERVVADVRDDAEARIRLAAGTYAFGRWRHRYRPYRRAVVAFMRWQQRRGVLNPPGHAVPGSPWWRAVNEALLRDTVEAKLLVLRGGGVPSRPSVARWVGFFESPSAQSWYSAHNASVVDGYLAYRELAWRETPAERFFMNVVLVRVLYAHTLVIDSKLALGRLSFLGGLVGHPRMKTPQALLAMKHVLPESYPIDSTEIGEIVAAESPLGRILDYGVIGARIDALFQISARALEEPHLLNLVREGTPAYAWPAGQRHVWRLRSRSRLASFVGALTHPSPA
jgi:hypothetical protein